MSRVDAPAGGGDQQVDLTDAFSVLVDNLRAAFVEQRTALEQTHEQLRRGVNEVLAQGLARAMEVQRSDSDALSSEIDRRLTASHEQVVETVERRVAASMTELEAQIAELKTQIAELKTQGSKIEDHVSGVRTEVVEDLRAVLDGSSTRDRMAREDDAVALRELVELGVSEAAARARDQGVLAQAQVAEWRAHVARLDERVDEVGTKVVDDVRSMLHEATTSAVAAQEASVVELRDLVRQVDDGVSHVRAELVDDVRATLHGASTRDEAARQADGATLRELVERTVAGAVESVREDLAKAVAQLRAEAVSPILDPRIDQLAAVLEQVADTQAHALDLLKAISG